MVERGQIRNKEYARQIIDFSGLRWNNITPTDIDLVAEVAGTIHGAVEFGGKGFLFYEYKFCDDRREIKLQRGQELFLTRLCDLLIVPSIVVVASHQHPPHEDIDAANAVAERLYFNKTWYTETFRTVKEVSDSFLEKIINLKQPK